MNNIAYIVAGDGTITMVLNKKTYVVGKSHLNYDKIKSHLIDRSFDQIENLLDISDMIIQKSNNRVRIVDGMVYFGNEIIHNSITAKIINLIAQEFPFDFMVKFLENVLQNENKDQLYRFLEHNNLPITPDGCFLAYKRVNADFKDVYTGKIDNKVGSIVSMPRHLVNGNPDETCSHGLHVCSLAYLKSYSTGNPIVIVKVNPKDVVSVPTDYNNTKMRVCSYEVVGTWSSDEVEAFDGDAVRNMDGTPYDVSEDYGLKPSGEKFYNVRDANGKFVSKSK